jgi:hypothetical protein
MIGAIDADDVTREFHQDVLEPGAGAEQRQVVLACVADRAVP